MKVLAIIPARNEQKAIGSVVMLSKKYVESVLVIDDGSTDKTALIAKLAGADVIRHSINKGKGEAMLTGLKWASMNDFDIVVFIDGDGQHDPAAIPSLIKPIKDGEVDITIGSRWHHVEGLSEMPFKRVFGNWILSTTTSLSLSKVIRDSQSGFRAFHMRTLDSLLTTSESGFAVESEMIALADNAGFRWKEVGIKASYKSLNTSTQTAWYHGLTVLTRALRVMRLNKPGRFFGSFSFLCFLISLAFVIWGRYAFPDENLLPIGYLYIIVFFIIVGGFSMFSAIMLSGLNVVSDKIFKIVIEMVSKEKQGKMK